MGTVIVLALLLGVGGFFVLLIGGLAAVGNAEAKQLKEGPAKYAEMFDGTEETVIYTAGGKVREAAIRAASEHGYRLAASADGRFDSTMTFEKV